MTRQQDTLDAKAAADDWAAQHGLPPSGGYSGQWYQDGYLGGWWPEGWSKWWSAYGITPGAILGGLIVAHQFTSSPVDQNVMLESEMGSIPIVIEPTADEFRQAMAYIRDDVLKPLRSYRLPKIRAAVAEIDRVTKQYGA